jgi:hypothetical protein
VQAQDFSFFARIQTGKQAIILYRDFPILVWPVENFRGSGKNSYSGRVSDTSKSSIFEQLLKQSKQGFF